MGPDWRVPPIAFGGSVSYDLNSNRTPGESKSISHLITTRVGANSYIYQPWFATVNGSLGLTVGRSRESREDELLQDPFASDQSAPTSRFLTGNARVNVFPRSRFPFEAHVERSDSRVDNGLASTFAFKTQNIGFSQQYRPASGDYSASAGFDRREQFGNGFRDTQNSLLGEFATKWKYNELSVGLSHSDARRNAVDEQTQFRSVVGRHQYAPASPMSISTTVNFTQTEQDAAAAAMDLSVLQLSTVGLWRPEGSKLALSSSARGLILRDAVDGNDAASVGLTLGATYELNKNVHFNANGNANLTDSNGKRAQGFGGSVGASWQADTIVIREFRYDWFASGTGSASTASGSIAGADDRQTTLGSQLGHTVSRVWPMTPQSGIAFNAGQTLSLTQNRSGDEESGRGAESMRVLLHNLGLSWNVTGDNRSAYARASASDSRELGGGGSAFQLFNFQLSGNFALDRNQSLSGDLTAQRTVQQIGGTLRATDAGLVLGERSSSTTMGGEIVYGHQRLFGIPRLRFTSRLKLAQDMLDQPGTFATIADRETRLWENRVDWLVGRLQTQLIFRISEVDGKRRDSLTFRVQRSFGD
jgi:hypothetical protein